MIQNELHHDCWQDAKMWILYNFVHIAIHSNMKPMAVAHTTRIPGYFIWSTFFCNREFENMTTQFTVIIRWPHILTFIPNSQGSVESLVGSQVECVLRSCRTSLWRNPVCMKIRGAEQKVGVTQFWNAFLEDYSSDLEGTMTKLWKSKNFNQSHKK